jgi:hypothetical protein
MKRHLSLIHTSLVVLMKHNWMRVKTKHFFEFRFYFCGPPPVLGDIVEWYRHRLQNHLVSLTSLRLISEFS